MQHMTHDTCQVGEGEPTLQIPAPQLLQFGIEGVLMDTPGLLNMSHLGQR